MQGNRDADPGSVEDDVNGGTQGDVMLVYVGIRFISILLISLGNKLPVIIGHPYT